jgi:hypothetical protein
MKTDPAFYLTCAGEYPPLAEPRACWIKRSLRDIYTQVHLYVEIAPSFKSKTGYVSSIVLSERQKDCSLADIRKWPAHAYVSEIQDIGAVYAEPFEAKVLRTIAWGRLYQIAADAERDAAAHSRAVKHVKTPEVVRVAELRFLREQYGAPEQILKSKLVNELFQNDARILRAYLAQVDLGSGIPNVALCLKTTTGPDAMIAQNALRVFSLLFRRQDVLDVLFLNDEQEQQLVRVCNPFYKRK